MSGVCVSCSKPCFFPLLLLSLLSNPAPMIELPANSYHLLTGPINTITINNLFARFVIEKNVSGKIFVDNIRAPEIFYLIHPYGMSLLFGRSDNDSFNKEFCRYMLNTNNSRVGFEWMQTFPREWDSVLSTLLGSKLVKQSENSEGKQQGIVELNTRVNFRFNVKKYLQTARNYESKEYKIIRTGLNEFAGVAGRVIPQRFWDNADNFLGKGIGFTLLDNGKIASTAYSAFSLGDKLEIGIETVDQFRGKGYAEIVCARLIDYCLEKNLEPIWSCRLENQASYNLAFKLGFEPTVMIPFYRLSC